MDLIFMVPVTGAAAALFALWLAYDVLRRDTGTAAMQEIAGMIFEGAMAFLKAEYYVLREQWNSVLKEGSRDQSGKTIGLPIEQAMQNVLAGQGLPVRPLESGPDKKDQSISVPSAASSGRVSMKGEQ